MCNHRCRNRNPFFVFFTVKLSGIRHQLTVKRPENTVIQAHSFGHVDFRQSSRRRGFHNSPVDPQAINHSANPSANFNPEFKAVSRMNRFIQLYHSFGMIFIQFLHTAYQHAPVVGTAVTHHQAALVFFQISSRKIPVENLLNIGQVLFRHFICAAFVTVHGAAVRINYHCHILRPLHTAFDFIGDNACVNHLWQNTQRVQIFRA